MSSSYGPSPGLIDHLQHVQRVDESIYLGIQIAGGHILLPILVLTILFSRKVSRNPIFVNFCVSWIISSVVYSLLVYRGRSTDGLLSLNPAYDPCLIQAALINGVQTWTACTTLAIVIHLWLLLRSSTRPELEKNGLLTKRYKELLYTCAFIGSPLAVFITFTVYSFVIGSGVALDSNTGQPIPGSNHSVPSVFYCIILENADFSHSLAPGLKNMRAVLIFTGLVSIITLGLEVIIVIDIFKKRKFLRQGTGHWYTLLLRVILFSIYRIVSLSLNLQIIIHPDERLLVGISLNYLFNGVIDYVQAAIPIVVFLVFATEKDILNAWCFWRKDKKQAENKTPTEKEDV